MAKVTGLGDNLYIGGYNLSGDINAINQISMPIHTLDFTGIDKSAHERIYGQSGGEIDFTSFFNPTTGQEHTILSTKPRTDTQVMYMRGTAIGNAAACMNAKQVTYDPKRGNDGSLVFSIKTQSNAFGLEWGVQLTAGLRTDTTATTGTGYDTGGSLSFGGQAYLQVTALTGTDITVKIQDSADNVTYADVSGLTFAQTTAAHTFQRISISNTSTIRRYVRATTVTTGGFTSCTFAVVLMKNPVAGVIF